MQQKKMKCKQIIKIVFSAKLLLWVVVLGSSDRVQETKPLFRSRDLEISTKHVGNNSS